MGRKNVELEHVEYRTDDIAHATAAFIKTFAQYSGIFGTKQWILAMFPLLEIIHNQKPQTYELSAEGIVVSFSGFPRPIPVIIDDERIVYQSREPRLTVEDRLSEILPRQRTHIGRVTNAIADEMHESYQLHIADKNPLILVFPKETYASDITHVHAALLT